MSNAKGYLKLMGMGAAFGITTSLLSGLSNEVVKQPLGFSPLSLKNLLKVGALSGGTFPVLVVADEKWKISDNLK